MPSITLNSSCVQTDATSYLSRLSVLFSEIGYHYDPPSPPPPGFRDEYDNWIQTTLGPALPSFDAKKLKGLGHASSGIAERAYPFADLEMSLMIAKLTTIAVALDDSIEDDEMYAQMAQFTHRVYLGMVQPPGILAMYHELIKEISVIFEGDAVLMGMAVVPWITYVDGCLMEKRLLTVDAELRASPLDLGYQPLSAQRKIPTTCSKVSGRDNTSTSLPTLQVSLKGDALNFPRYLRQKTGVSEPYAVSVFKASKLQQLPLTRFIQVLPDLTFWIEAVNDVLSFHKEQLEGETFNFIHLRNQALAAAPPRKGSGQHGEWTIDDTFGLFCDEIREAGLRIDAMLGVEEIEKRRTNNRDVDTVVDEAIATQWRQFRDGYISWHLESRRYKLPEFLKRN